MPAAQRNLVNLPRAISALLAAVVAAFAFAATLPNGDPEATIAQTELEISGVVARHTFQLKDSSARTPDDAARSLYRMSGAKGELLFLEGPAGRGRAEVEHIFAKIYNSGWDRYLAQDSALSDLRKVASRLAPQNQNLAQAKGLLRFESRPAAVSEKAWRERLPDSINPWQIQEL